MFRKLLTLTAFVIYISTVLTAGCSYETNLNYIKAPDEMYLVGDANLKNIEELNNEYNSLDDKKDMQKKDEISKKISELILKSTIHIKDKAFINYLLTGIHNSKVVKKETNFDIKYPDFLQVQFVYNDIEATKVLKGINKPIISQSHNDIDKLKKGI